MSDSHLRWQFKLGATCGGSSSLELKLAAGRHAGYWERCEWSLRDSGWRRVATAHPVPYLNSNFQLELPQRGYSHLNSNFQLELAASGGA